MATETQDSIRMKAIEWHIRLRDGGDDAWERFAEWLAENPLHAEAYDAVERMDHAIEPLLGDVVFHEAANDSDELNTRPLPSTRRWFLSGGVMAAGIVAALVLGPPMLSSRYDVATGPGERRIVTLDPATQVVLNGSTRMTFDRENPRFAAMDEGEALFRIRHDEARPFVLELGDNRVEDAGTVFNVVRVPSQVRVAVAEGKVIYNPGRDRIMLDPGQALVDEDAANGVRVTQAPLETVGAWEKGQLGYYQTPMSQVAADIGRTLGVHITVPPLLADRRFSGSVVLRGKRPDEIRRLELALNVRLMADRNGWTMKPIDGAER
jgi:transmembrane sensor